LRRIDRDAAHLVGTRLADGGEDVGVGRVDALFIGREERAALQDGDAGKLPVADEAVEDRALVEPGLPVTEGEVVEIVGQEAVTAVVDDVAIVEAGVEAVGEEAAAGDREGVGRGAAGVG
jgi:hypothetical protein